MKTSMIAGAETKDVPLGQLLSLRDVAEVRKNDARFQNERIPAPASRANLKEGEVVVTRGWLHLVAAETDGDYHIQISADQTDGNNCLIVEVPKDAPAYVKSAPLRTEFGSVRQWVRTKLLASREPATSGSIMRHPPYVRVTGALFFDDSHVGAPPRGKKGMKAATLWELHPVTAMSFAPVSMKTVQSIGLSP